MSNAGVLYLRCNLSHFWAPCSFSFFLYARLIMKKIVGFCEILCMFGEEEYFNMKKSCCHRLLDPVPSSSGPLNIYGSRDR